MLDHYLVTYIGMLLALLAFGLSCYVTGFIFGRWSRHDEDR